MDGLSGDVAKLEPDKETCGNGCIGRKDDTGVVSGVGEVRERDGGTSNVPEADWELRSCLGEDRLWTRLGDFSASPIRLVLPGDMFFSFP